MTMRHKTKLFFASQSLIGFLASPAGQHCVTNFAQNKFFLASAHFGYMPITHLILHKIISHGISCREDMIFA